MIIISDALALALAGDDNADLPVLLWRQIVTLANISADSEAAGFPATNLVNPATDLKWVSDSTAEQLILIDQATEDEVDSVGIARHNFGSASVTVSVEALLDGNWEEVVEPFIPPDDKPLIMLFEAIAVEGVRIRLVPDGVEPEAAVLFVGLSLRMERGVQPHDPMPYARRRDHYGARSVSGEFLGQVVTGRQVSTVAVFRFLTGEFYRDELDEFVEASAETPFFFGWKPSTYPQESGFGWLTGEAQRQWEFPDFVHVTLQIDGLGL